MNVSSSAGVTGTRPQSTTLGSAGRVNKQEFLNLLVTELRYQNPLEPMNTSEYMSQLAQFGTLEEIQNLSRLATYSYSASLLGRRVSALDSSGQVVSGTAAGVRQAPDGTLLVRLRRENGSEIEVDLGAIQEVVAA